MPVAVAVIFCLIIGLPTGAIKELRGELVDHFIHEESFYACPYTIKGFIPYEMRINKKNYILPKGADPWKYIKNYDPKNRRHLNIVISSMEEE